MSERQTAPYGTVVYAGPVSRRFRGDMPLDGGHDYGVELGTGTQREPDVAAAAEGAVVTADAEAVVVGTQERPVTAPAPFGGSPDAVASSFVAAQGIARQYGGAEVHVTMGFEAEQLRSSHQL